jgi:hypothetical protein
MDRNYAPMIAVFQRVIARTRRSAARTSSFWRLGFAGLPLVFTGRLKDARMPSMADDVATDLLIVRFRLKFTLVDRSSGVSQRLWRWSVFPSFGLSGTPTGWTQRLMMEKLCR